MYHLLPLLLSVVVVPVAQKVPPLTVAVIGSGCVIVTDVVAVHPLLSVTVKCIGACLQVPFVQV